MKPCCSTQEIGDLEIWKTSVECSPDASADDLEKRPPTFAETSSDSRGRKNNSTGVLRNTPVNERICCNISASRTRNLGKLRSVIWSIFDQESNQYSCNNLGKWSNVSVNVQNTSLLGVGPRPMNMTYEETQVHQQELRNNWHWCFDRRCKSSVRDSWQGNRNWLGWGDFFNWK